MISPRSTEIRLDLSRSDPLVITRWNGYPMKNPIKKHGDRGKLGQERLEVGWEVVMFLFNIVNLNV